ncbi:unnamed protein product [Heligmosomoides polygyrus]|uniref:Reverse transcriptase domain-containing protein n=1 Tax=Heligmosomoides polygyrus TaxID=6339 RepID=A0A183GCW2_HELPZ|nr:unnamed protein product [Heligmosomoides polygyrus]
MTFTKEMKAALSSLDQCDLATLVAYIISRFEDMEELMRANAAALKTVLERSAPTSACAFCSVEENRDVHFTGRCLKPSHQDDCVVKCGGCGLDPHPLIDSCSFQRSTTTQLHTIWATTTTLELDLMGNRSTSTLWAVGFRWATSSSLNNFNKYGQPIDVDFMGSRLHMGTVDHGHRRRFLYVMS